MFIEDLNNQKHINAYNAAIIHKHALHINKFLMGIWTDIDLHYNDTTTE